MDQITPPPVAVRQAELNAFAARRPIGRTEHVARHHAGDPLAVREQIDQCLDVGSSPERGWIAGIIDLPQPLCGFANFAVALRTPGPSLFAMRA
jgi:hypothetical protein